MADDVLDRPDIDFGADVPWGLDIDFGTPAPAPALPPGFQLDAPSPSLTQQALGAVTDPVWWWQIPKRVPGGIVQSAGTTLQGPDAAIAGLEIAGQQTRQRQLEVMDRVDRGERVRPIDDIFGHQDASPEQRADIRARVTAEIASSTPTPVQERSLYQAGEAVREFGRKGGEGWLGWLVPPATPGYEQAVSTQLGEGVGSMVFGLPFAMLGGVPGGLAAFGSMGMGEATHRAVEYDKKERAEGRPGLTQEQIVTAGLLGIGPGTTDVLPIEIMLGRIPLPGITAAMRRPLAAAIARIGGQAFVEGVQEGGQQFLQNLIAQQVYNPEQGLGQDVIPNVGFGAGVGGITQGGQEVARGLMGGRRGGRGAGSAPPPNQFVTPESSQAVRAAIGTSRCVSHRDLGRP